MKALAIFHPFPRLPVELRLKIWLAALPSRVVEPEIDCDASLIYGEHNKGLQRPNVGHVPALFTVNAESRNFCLEQYFAFAGTYIHPTMDVLLFSMEDEKKFRLYSPSFLHLSNRPAEKLDTIAIEVDYNQPDLDISGHLYWIHGLGCPQKLIICPAPLYRETNELLAEHFMRISGTSQITGSDFNRSQLVKWPLEIDGDAVQRIRPKLIQALQKEKLTQRNFEIPVVDDDLYFVYSDPDYYLRLGNLTLK